VDASRVDASMVTVRYFAAARAAVGVEEEIVEAHTLDALLRLLADTRGESLAKVLGCASFLVDGLSWHDRETPLPVGATVDVLPPFAGG
jgi:molybdopterin converting factor small subunit